ncbi:MAG: peptide deformylase [Bacteroidales bacterium]|nr:peptide deformylase [Bacteroidales bacterium]
MGNPFWLIICVSTLCVTHLLFTSCADNSGWAEEEKAVIASAQPGTAPDSSVTGSAAAAPEILRVLTIADPADSVFLRQQCKDFTPEMLTSPEYASLAKLMVATVTDPSEDGVGIAGPQVGISRRVVAVQRFDKPGEPFEVYPNIRIVATRGDLCPGPEGCLSVPGRRGNVLRYRDIDIQYTLVPSPASGSPASSSSGNSSAGRAPRTRPTLRDTTERIQGFTAVIFQHECDHLDGVLYIDKLEPAL